MAEKKQAPRVTVEAIENKTEKWIHRGQVMKPGDTGEVTEAQLKRLVASKLVKRV